MKGQLQPVRDGVSDVTIVAALAELRQGELRALIDCAHESSQIAPGLQKWIAHAAEWELHRRLGKNFYLQSPRSAIDSSESAACIASATMLRRQLERGAIRVAALFDAFLRALAGGSRGKLTA